MRACPRNRNKRARPPLPKYNKYGLCQPCPSPVLPGLFLAWIAFYAGAPAAKAGDDPSSRPGRMSRPGFAATEVDCRRSLVPPQIANSTRVPTPAEMMWYDKKSISLRYTAPNGAHTIIEGTLMNVIHDGNEWQVHLAAQGRTDRIRVIPHSALESVTPQTNMVDRVSMPGGMERERDAAMPLVSRKAETVLMGEARYAWNTAAIERNNGRIRHIMGLLAANDAETALTAIYREHFQGLIINMPEFLYGPDNPDSLANMRELQAKPLRFQQP